MKNLIRILLIAFIGTAITGAGTQANTVIPSDDPVSIKESTNGVLHFDRVIGEVQDGQILFVGDKAEIVASWTKVLNMHSDFTIAFTDIQISKEGEFYFLRGRDEQNLASSAVQLILDADKLYERKYLPEGSDEAGHGYTVTCSGCLSTGSGSAGECQPELLQGSGWYCSDCSEGTCTKSTTSGGGGAIP